MQASLFQFGRIPAAELSTALPLRTCLQQAMRTRVVPRERLRALPTTEALIEEYVAQLQRRAAMLDDYFSIRIDDTGALRSLPLPVEHILASAFNPTNNSVYYLYNGGAQPNARLVPLFVLELAVCVDWTIERHCFEHILRTIARLYERKWACDVLNSMVKTFNSIDFPAVLGVQVTWSRLRAAACRGAQCYITSFCPPSSANCCHPVAG